MLDCEFPRELEEGMRTIFRSVSLAVLLAALFAVSGVSSYAQDACGDVDAINALYTSIVGNKEYASNDVPTLQKAIDAGKQFQEKYGSCDIAKTNSDWIGKNLPKWEARLSEQKGFAARADVLKRFDTAVQAKNADAAFSSGEEFLSKYPADDPARIHVVVTLANLGYNETFNKNTKYAANSLKYSKASLDMIKAGAPEKKEGGYGNYTFWCANKADCVSQLTYETGYLTYFGQNDKPGGLTYFYQATTLPGAFQKYPATYGIIGDYYKESVLKLSDELKTKIAAQNAADADDVKAQKEADIKQTIGMLNGYIERAMDAYSRAYNIAKNDPKLKAYSDGLYSQIQALYKVRFPKNEGLDAWIGSVVAKPFPDPSTAVTPVTDADTSTTSTGGTETGVGAVNSNGVGAANGSGVANTAAAKTAAAAKPVKRP
jgi:hypothetical protein